MIIGAWEILIVLILGLICLGLLTGGLIIYLAKRKKEDKVSGGTPPRID